MESKKINQLATEMSPAATDLTIIGDPITGVSKKITLEQIASLFAGSVSFYANLAAFPVTGTIDTIYCAKDTNKLYLWSGSAYVQTFPSQALLDTYQLRSEKGASNGYASLDSAGKVPITQLPSSIMEYKGMWSAATNTPTLANGTGDTGDVYICNAAGSVNFGAGAITFAVGDYVIYSGSIWQRSSGAVGTVTSVGITESGDSLNITGSPITTSGTINIGFNGTNLQYINGAGNLVTFPTTIAQAQRLITEVYNETGATLTKGTVVYINGGHGNLPTVTKAIATGDATSAQTYGVVQNDITDNNNGYVVVLGSLGDLDTQAYPNGTQLYLSSTTAGAWTSTKQYAPAHLVYVGIVVRSHPTQGVVEVRIQNGFELDELHNVSAQTPTNNQGLFYNSSTSLWENKSIATALGYTPANDASVVHLAGTETITGAKTFSGLQSFTNTAGTDLTYGAYLTKNSIPSAFSSTTVNLYSASGNNNLVVRDNGNTSKLQFQAISSYTYTFPALTGTLALTSDISYPVTSVFGRTGAVVATEGDYSLTQLGDVTVTTPSSGQVLRYNGTSWENSTESYVGTVTSVGLSAPTGFSVSGSPVTSSGTLALTFAAGYSLPTNASQTNWDTAYTNRITSATAPLSITSNVISISQATTSTNGYLSSTDWNTFNGKQTALNGTGFVKISGTTISYDNSTYLTTSAAASTYLPLTGGVLTGNLTMGSTTAGKNLIAYASSYGNTGLVRLYGTDGLEKLQLGSFADGGYVYSSGTLYLYNGGSNTFTLTGTTAQITNGNNLEVGYSAVQNLYKLDVNGTGRFTRMIVGGTATSRILQVNTSGNDGIRIQTSGDNPTLDMMQTAAANAGARNWRIVTNWEGWGTMDFQSGTNNTNDPSTTRLSISGTTGAATFSSSVTASGGNFGGGTPTGSVLFVNGTIDAWQSSNTLLRLNHTGSYGKIETFTGGGYGNTAINPSGGNVLIGTSTDRGFKLVVEGTDNNNLMGSYNTTSGASLRMQSNQTVNYIVSATNQLQFEVGAAIRMAITTGGNVLIGTTTDAGYKLDVNGTGRFAASYTASGTVALSIWQRAGGAVSSDMTYNDANTSMNFGTSTSHTLNIKTNNTTALSIASTGAATFSSSVAINGTFVQYPSSGSGGFYIDRGTSSGSPYISWLNGSGTRLGYMGYSNTNIGLYLENSANFTVTGGNVLIGTTTDAGYKLYVDGGSSNGMAFYSTSPGNQFKIAGSAAAMTFSNTISAPSMGGSLGVATSAGDFLSGTAAGDTIFINQFSGKRLYAVSYSGGVYLSSGATSWTANSDIRLKNINSYIENAVEKLSTLQTINFSYKDDKTNKQNLGLIAQEVEKIFPELIDKNGDGMLGVRYTELVPVLIKAVQELKLEIETLKNK